MLIIDDKPVEYSAEWKGPVKSRSCTDTPWLIIFTVFMACWISVGYYALTYGDLPEFESETNAPRDSSGRRCGFDNGVKNAPYLVFFDFNDCYDFSCLSARSVCREKCPDLNWYSNFVQWEQESVEEIRKNMICKSYIDVTTRNKAELRELIDYGSCAKLYLKSESIRGRCIPEKVPEELKILITEWQLENMRKIIIGNSRPDSIETYGDWRLEGITILKFIAISAAICLLYLILLRWFAFEFTLISGAIQCAFFSYLSYYSAQDYTENNTSSGITGAIIFGMIAVLIALIVLILWSDIKAACQLIKEASTAVMSISSSLLYPILPSLLHVAATVFCVINIVCLLSIKNLEGWQSGLLVVVNLVGFLWFYCFVTALGQMVLAFAFASWYWTFDKLNVPYFTVLVGFGKTTRYHLGTVALGSLLITIFRTIRILLEATRRVRGGAIIFCLVSSCLKSLESFIKFMNRNAYIQCALYGEGLCDSASAALSLIIRNAGRVIILNNVVSWVLWLGKILITAGMSLWAWTYYEPLYGEQWIMPVILVAVGTWFVVCAFFSVFTVAVDTIFLCFLEDTERNDGTSARPYYMSRKLRKMLQMELE